MVPLADLFRIEKGKIGIKAAIPGDFPLVTTGESYLSHSEAHFTGDAVCIPMISATGHGHASIKRLHHIQGAFSVGSILCACINQQPERVLTRFMFHYLTACKEQVLIPLMQGSANVSLKLADIASISVPLPSLAEQEITVERIDQLADKVRKINEHLDAIEIDAEALIRSYIFSPSEKSITKRKLSELVSLRQPDVAVDQLKSYQFAGVYSFGRGVFASVNKAGSEFAYPRLSTVKIGE
ncbi:restriction endonuclease subunit S [Methylomonas sp. UP202]|uniref:restriction endonuclease subunit S n=1 Tax=Methylomonas sp. UP202 TaxID=3040943 RepID=UPI0024794CF6|nr:restriction endonuclease subunit S [Methylomonas sp. UP202]WGS84076.1 restriction endonuclease subunit S [Methylomonas sp. UP202]